jgi:hypothetical protein
MGVHGTTASDGLNIYAGHRVPGTRAHAASRACAAITGKVTLLVLASWDLMSKSSSRRFPVTITHLPVTRCQICHRTVAYRPGKVSEA